MKKIGKFFLFISLFYTLFYFLIIEDYIIENVRERYSILFDTVSEIEPIDYYADGEDSFAPIYEEDDQAVLDEANGYINQAQEPFSTISNLTFFLSFIGIATYGKELIQKPLYLRLALSLYLSSSFFGLIYNFTKLRYIVFFTILYFLFKLFQRNKSKESSMIYIFAYIAIAILFNPFMHLHFNKDTWLFIDLFTIVIVLIEPFLIKVINKEHNTENTQSLR